MTNSTDDYPDNVDLLAALGRFCEGKDFVSIQQFLATHRDFSDTTETRKATAAALRGLGFIRGYVRSAAIEQPAPQTFAFAPGSLSGQIGALIEERSEIRTEDLWNVLGAPEPAAEAMQEIEAALRGLGLTEQRRRIHGGRLDRVWQRAEGGR